MWWRWTIAWCKWMDKTLSIKHVAMFSMSPIFYATHIHTYWEKRHTRPPKKKKKKSAHTHTHTHNWSISAHSHTHSRARAHISLNIHLGVILRIHCARGSIGFCCYSWIRICTLHTRACIVHTRSCAPCPILPPFNCKKPSLMNKVPLFCHIHCVLVELYFFTVFLLCGCGCVCALCWYAYVLAQAFTSFRPNAYFP